MTILTTEQQVLEDLDGVDTVVLWQFDDPFLSTSVYHRFDGTGRWTLYDPEDDFATVHDYANENLWAIATLRTPTSTISVADGTQRVASFEELEALPRYVVAQVGDDIFQNYGGEWWRLDPWSNPDEDTLSPKEMWDWHGSTEDGITILWHPAETGWTN